MKKRFTVLLLIIASALAGLFGLTGCKIENSGITPDVTINADGYWVINGEVTDVKAQGSDGADGVTPNVAINTDGYWVINGEVTDVKAQGSDGTDGVTPNVAINADGYWVINGEVTDVKAQGTDGADGSKWFAESGLSSDGKGADGDLYINLENYDIYIKTNGEWIKFNKTAEGTEGLAYTAIKEDGEITGYNVRGLGIASDVDVVIPSTYKGKPVVEISDYAFQGCATLTSVIIPDSVTRIGFFAFQGCTGLTSLTIGNGVKKIENAAFGNCVKLTDVSLPDSVTNISSGAFDGCKGLNSFTVSAGNKNYSSQDGILYNYYETTIMRVPQAKSGAITVSERVSTISDSAFKDCKNLTSITVSEGNKFYSSQDGILYNKAKTKFIHIPVCVSGNVNIPEGITAIDDAAFYNRVELTGIAIPDSVTSIGVDVFENCVKLENIAVSNGNANYSSQDGILYDKAKTEIIYIPEELKGSITIPDGVTSIGDGAFKYCFELESITVSEGNANYSSQDGILYNKAKTEIIHVPQAIQGSVTISDGVTSIGERAFYGCRSLTSITLPNGLTSIGEAAFVWCVGLTSITLPDGLTSIGEAAFGVCNGLTSITIPSSVTNMGRAVFHACHGLTSVTISDGVTSISEGAFEECRGLTSITIPDSVTSIGEGAFKNCSAFTSINYDGTIEQWKAITKGGDWDYNTGNYTVTCTDGDLDSDGNEITV